VRLTERVAPTAVEIDDHAHIGTVEDVDELCDWSSVPKPAKHLTQVIVGIDDGEARLGNRGCFGDQLLPRQILFDVHEYLC
jgi:hypothetical protein